MGAPTAANAGLVARTRELLESPKSTTAHGPSGRTHRRANSCSTSCTAHLPSDDGLTPLHEHVRPLSNTPRHTSGSPLCTADSSRAERGSPGSAPPAYAPQPRLLFPESHDKPKTTSEVFRPAHLTGSGPRTASTDDASAANALRRHSRQHHSPSPGSAPTRSLPAIPHAAQAANHPYSRPALSLRPRGPASGASFLHIDTGSEDDEECEPGSAW